MNIDNVFVAILDINGKQIIEPVLALDKKDALKTLEEQYSLAIVLMLNTLKEMVKLEEKYASSKSDFFAIEKDAFELVDVKGISAKEAASGSQFNKLVLSKEDFMGILSSCALEFNQKLNSSPIVSEMVGANLL